MNCKFIANIGLLFPKSEHFLNKLSDNKFLKNFLCLLKYIKFAVAKIDWATWGSWYLTDRPNTVITHYNDRLMTIRYRVQDFEPSAQNDSEALLLHNNLSELQPFMFLNTNGFVDRRRCECQPANRCNEVHLTINTI
jgi:hypothetical protein